MYCSKEIVKLYYVLVKHSLYACQYCNNYLVTNDTIDEWVFIVFISKPIGYSGIYCKIVIN